MKPLMLSCNSSKKDTCIYVAVVLTVAGLLLLWFRISMNYGSDPIFKSEELKAAFHPNRSVR